MRLLRNLLFGLSIVTAINPTQTFSQSATQGPRILERVDDNQLVTLKGNVHPAANARNDLGPVRPNLAMTDVILVLSRSPEQQAAFDEFVAGQYDSSSPNFHHWLEPAEVGERFGPSLADIATISNWLASHGLSVAAVSKDRMSIRCGGTADQVEGAFHTEIHNLSVNGERHIANMSDPQIPAALAPVVAGIKGLHNFLPHPLHRMGSKVQFNPDSHAWVKAQNPTGLNLAAGGSRSQPFAPAAKSVSSPQPDFYFPFSGTSGAVEEDIAPYDFAAIYNLPSGWPNSNNGSGQTIAIIGTSDIDLTDVATFKSSFGLPAGTPPVIAHGPDGDPGICTGSTNACNGGDLDENSLDVEWSGAVAPGAQVVLVTDAYNSQNPSDVTNDPIFDGGQWVVDNADVQGTGVYGARIISISYGECELFNGTASNVAYNNLWQTAASAGIAVFVASGDGGSAGCDQGGDAGGYPYEAQYGVTVSGLSSTPYNTAVGGTDFSWCKPSYTVSGNKAVFQGCASSNATTYWNTSNTTQQASAKGYVAEIPWNDSCLNPIWTAYFQSVAPLFGYTAPANGEAACNFIYSDWSAVNQDNQNNGGGQFVIAPWVDSVGGAGGASGCVVSSTSSTIGSCGAGDTTTGSPYNLTLVNDGWPKPSWQTNAAIPGLPADGVRDLPDVSFFAGDGALDSATLICVSNDGATCTNISATASGAAGEAEEVGGTSVATPQMAGVMALINQKAGASQGNPNAELYSLAAKQTYASCSAETVLSTSASCYFNDIDQGTNAMPCDYQGKATEGGAAYNGSSWVFPASSAGLASPNCTIVNSGDVVGTLAGYGATLGYDQATGLGSLNVANVLNGWTATTGTGTATVTVTPTPTTIAVNQSLSVAVNVTATSGTPTGTVTLVSLGYSSAAQTLSTGPYTFTIPAYTLSGGTDTLIASYSGDTNFAAASASTPVTVTKLTPTGVSVTPSANSIAVNAALTVTGSVSVPASDPVPTGTVTLTSGNYTSAATGLSGGAYSIVIPASSLIVGSDTLTVAYSGDNNYSTVSGAATVTVTAPPAPATYALSATAPTAVSPGSSATSTVTVTASNGYAGTVALSCSLTSSPTGASDVPTCAATSGSPVTLSTTATTGTATVTVTTTAATSGALVRPDFRRSGMTLASLGVAAFALLALLGIPTQRRSLRAMLGVLVLLATLGSLAACGGGGGGGSGGGGTGNPGTTAGAYTFTVTGTGNPAVTPAPTITFTVTVN